MIIFVNKETGAIEGTIEGRIHGKEHMGMWIGEDRTFRIVVQWRPFMFWDREGNMVLEDSTDNKGNRLAFTADFEPGYPDTEGRKMDEDEQRFWFEIDRNPSKLQEYKVDLKTLKLVRK